ncbi:TPA: DNA breaking-rejoining protein, partial [Salmonella enterica subsp. enterica serovar Kottbus]
NLRPAMDFAKRIIAEDREDWKQMSMTVGIIPDIKGYDRQTIIDLARKAPKAVHNGNPDLRRTWCESFLAVHGVRDPDWYEYVPDNTPTTHEENAARLRQAGKCLRDIEAGRFQCDEEKPQPTGELADEPATPEAVEQDTTEHHPDPQPLENEPPVSQTEAGYQKIRAELHEARKNIPPKNPVDVGKQLAAERGDFVPGISDPDDPKWVRDDYSASNEGEKTENEDADDVNQNDDAVIQNTDSVNHSEPVADQIEPEAPETEPKNQKPEPVTKIADGVFDASAFFADTSNQGKKKEDPQPTSDVVTASAQEGEFIPVQEWPTYFEPGRYEGVPNDIYHAANGISSTMLKDARMSLMYYYGRHIAKTIPLQQSDAFTFGNFVHCYVLEPEKFDDEFALPAEMPKDVVSTTADLISIIKEYNASLPALMTPDELKARIESYNSELIPPLSLSGDAEEIGGLYMSLPDEFRRLPEDEKYTVAKMKACIKEYNSSLTPMLKTSGTREQLLDQIATVAPVFAEQERAKFIPYNTSGTKEQLTDIVREIHPDIVTADDWHKQQEEASKGKTMISLEMYQRAKNINVALQANKDASWLLNHPARKSEVSYFGFDEETGQEIRVRPDIEIRFPSYLDSICADLKTISMGYVPQERLKARLHREIIERGYHISAAMYCDVAELKVFAWIFVNKDPGYHWVAVVYASKELLELGRQEYRRLLRQINEATFTDNWPAPITGQYVDELNDHDINRLSELTEVKLEDLS